MSGGLAGLISVIVVVIGAVITIIKREKIKDAMEIMKAGLTSIGGSVSATDDTPNRLTPAEIGEAVEKAGAKAKEVLRDM